MAIRVAIVDDHQLIREGLRSMLASIDDVELIAEGATGEEALRIAREQEPDILFLDIELPDISGIAITRRLRDEISIVRVVGVSAYDFRRYVYGVLNHGAFGFVRKEELSGALLTRLISDVMSGRIPWISAELATSLVRERTVTYETRRVIDQLSAREREVLEYVARGADTPAIAERLSISEVTVRNHVDHLRAKVDVKTRAELVAWAWSRGVVEREG